MDAARVYHVALFFHVFGMMVFCAALGVLLAAIVQVQRASTVEQLRIWSGLGHSSGNVFQLANGLILLPGLYMMATTWGWLTAWIDVALGALLVMAWVGATVISPRIDALYQAALASRPGPIPEALQQRQTVAQLTPGRYNRGRAQCNRHTPCVVAHGRAPN